MTASRREGGRRRVVVLTGAGMSAESGLRTFRDGDGLWEEHRVEDVATPEAFARDPELVLRFYDQRRLQVAAAEPNAAHLALVALEECCEVEIVTQNIDDLHERAGSTRVLHLHGEILKVQSTANPERVQEWGPRDLPLGTPAGDGGVLRPHVVWFGEPVPAMERAAPRVAEADILMVIGTSLAVYPAASLVHYAPAHAEVIVVDPAAPPVDHPRVRTLAVAATEGVPQLVAEFLSAGSGD